MLMNLGYVQSTLSSSERDLVYQLWSMLARGEAQISILNLKKFLLAIEGICYDSLYGTHAPTLYSDNEGLHFTP